jgi:hypothetical protein
MKVFDKVAIKEITKEEKIIFLRKRGEISCVINDENHYISENEINKLCDGNCEECLSKYLDMEVEE